VVRFWDSSALVSLVVEEPRSDACRRLLRDGAGIAVWTLTRTEMVSAVWQRARMGKVPSSALAKALAKIEAMSRGWTEVSDVEGVRDRAERALGQHELRAADALQLGAALLLTNDRPKGRDFVTADGALARAAMVDGFRVLIQR
jgi:predicted nucleic acid-binding protein